MKETPEVVWEFDDASSSFSREYFLNVFAPAVNPSWDAFTPGTTFNVSVPHKEDGVRYYTYAQFIFKGWMLKCRPGYLWTDLDKVMRLRGEE